MFHCWPTGKYQDHQQGGWRRGHGHHAAATFRTRVADLPSTFAHLALASATQLHELILNNYGIDMLHVHTSTHWMNNEQTHDYAFLEVTDEAEGDYLRRSLSGTGINGFRLFIE